jgi:hypothetical protein
VKVGKKNRLGGLLVDGADLLVLYLDPIGKSSFLAKVTVFWIKN